MGMMGMFKWLRKDIVQRERDGRNIIQKQCGLNNESYRNALQAFIDRRRFDGDVAGPETEAPSSPDKKRADLLAKNNNYNNNNRCDNDWKSQEHRSATPGVPHIRASEIFEIGWVAGTEDRYVELIFAEWQNTRVSLKRHTHPECKDAVKADLEVLSEIRHPNILLLMATTQTDDHGLVSIFESVDCTLYNYVHEQGERISIQGIAKCGGRLSDALRHSHMRGYIHGAISSHCVYLTSNGIVKLGGWELAVHTSNPKPKREYEERLRAEIFKWQAPEIFQGYEPRKESDVYGLTLLIWEMCTMHIPWIGYNRADVERNYVHWKRGVILDLYDFPPLLNNLLEAGLQLDVAKRTLDMNRMRRFLQRLEMQYEDEEPIYIDQFANNNNENGKTYASPVSASPIAASKRNTRLTKSASAKQLSTLKNPGSSSKQYLCSKKIASKTSGNPKIPAHTEQINVFADDINYNAKDEMQKNTNIFHNVQNNHTKVNYPNFKADDSDSVENEESHFISTLQPWNTTYRKVQVPKEIAGSRSMVHSNSSPLESTDDESFKDARSNLQQLKEALAYRREHFFYGSDSSRISTDTSPKAKNTMFTETRSKDYEPHKPASHKTSLEPRFNKSPGQYDSSYMKPSFKQCRKVPYLHTPESVKDAVIQRQVLNSDPQSFFESSLWRKEKLICISRMRKSCEDEPTYLISECTNTNDNIDTMPNDNQFTESDSLNSEKTYILNTKKKAINETETTREGSTQTSGAIDNSAEVDHSQSKPLQTLKDALDRATKIVRSVTPNTDDSCSSSPFKTYENFELSTDEVQTSKCIFEDLYDLQINDDSEEIKSIERSTNETYLLYKNANSTISNNETRKNCSEDINTDATSYENPSQSYDTTYSRNFVCESIAEVSSEFNVSFNDTKSENRTVSYTDKKTVDEESKNPSELIKNTVTMQIERKSDPPRIGTDGNEKKCIMSNLTLMLLNDAAKVKNCKSCHQSALPRRRSLPAALSQLRGVNNSALGKLPIRRADMPDSNVEEFYFDDEFGDSLNVNMVLLDEDIFLDENFLPEISEL